MSTLAIPNQEKFTKKPFHRRNGSDELDVFEASRYFSSANEVFNYNNSNMAQKNIREVRKETRGARISLDMTLMRNSIPSQNLQKEDSTKAKKIKTPSSPGGKLASFLNSIFNQTALKKKSSKSLSHSTKEKDVIPGERKRRSSISYFGSTFSRDSKSAFSTTTASGCRTPPPYVNADTPIKAYKVWNSSRSDISGYIKPSSLQNEVNFVKEFKLITQGILEKPMTCNRIVEKNERTEMKKFDELDDGMESDASSDLFELTNYDLGYHSSGLPVYETTHMDTIKREPLI